MLSICFKKLLLFYLFLYFYLNFYKKKYALKKSESNKDFKSLVLILFAGFLLRQ